jgi:integrase
VIKDSETPGLQLVVYPNGSKRWRLYFRTADGRQRRQIIGDALQLRPEDARERARELIVDVAKGADPAAERTERRQAPTVGELCDAYLEQARTSKKPRTVAMDELMIEKWIKPQWGSRKAASIGPKDAERLHASLKDTPARANRVRALVSHMFGMAERWGWHEGPNPTKHVKRYPEKPTHRPLSEIELKRLGRVLDEWPHEERQATRVQRGERRGETVMRPPTEEEQAERRRMADVIRLITLTGCRKGEILELTWPEVDLDSALIRLIDAKAGARVVWLSAPAVAILRRQERAALTPYVFPGRKQGRPIGGLQRAWEAIRKRAGLEDVRTHDLRHTAGAHAAAKGLGQAQIARLLGHRQTRTADIYTQPHADPAARAAELVGEGLADALGLEAVVGADDDGANDANR